MKALLLGDICPTEENFQLYGEAKTEDIFTDALPIMQSADFVAVNLECAITEHDKAIAKFGPPLKAPFGTAKVLKEAGVTLAGISNNHVFDFGKIGAMDTLKALSDTGVDTTGFGDNYYDSRRNYVFEKDGQKICVIAVCEHEYSYALEDRMGSRPFDEYETLEDVREAAQKYDRVVVMYHGAKELCKYPSPRIYRLCRAMARAGADVVLCQHSHCIGAYEKYEDCHILYGQGNFQFSWPGWDEMWYTALIVSYDTVTNEIEFIPSKIVGNHTELLKGEEKDKVMAEFEKRNAEMLNGKWKDGWHEFCEANRAFYAGSIAKSVSENATQAEKDYFGHLLDCEAHTDVWRELFPTYNLTNER